VKLVRVLSRKERKEKVEQIGEITEKKTGITLLHERDKIK